LNGSLAANWDTGGATKFSDRIGKERNVAFRTLKATYMAEEWNSTNL